MILDELKRERDRQDQKFPDQHLPDGTGPDEYWMFDDPNGGHELANDVRNYVDKLAKEGKLTWNFVLLEEVAEAFAEEDLIKLRAELLQVAAVVVRWIEDIDRRGTRKEVKHGRNRDIEGSGPVAGRREHAPEGAQTR